MSIGLSFIDFGDRFFDLGDLPFWLLLQILNKPAVLEKAQTSLVSGPYKSALISALLLYCAQGAVIEEHRNRRAPQ